MWTKIHIMAASSLNYVEFMLAACSSTCTIEIERVRIISKVEVIHIKLRSERMPLCTMHKVLYSLLQKSHTVQMLTLWGFPCSKGVKQTVSESFWGNIAMWLNDMCLVLLFSSPIYQYLHRCVYVRIQRINVFTSFCTWSSNLFFFSTHPYTSNPRCKFSSLSFKLLLALSTNFEVFPFFFFQTGTIP